MPVATYVQEGNSLDYTPVADVAAGDVIDLGGYVGIAHAPILANQLGALRIVGVFEIAKDAAAIGAGVKVFWGVSAGKASATGPGDAVLGYSLGAAAAGDSTVRVYVHPGLS